jgi:putative DNA primase/helicase
MHVDDTTHNDENKRGVNDLAGMLFGDLGPDGLAKMPAPNGNGQGPVPVDPAAPLADQLTMTADGQLTTLITVPDALRILPQRLDFPETVPSPKRPGAVADLIAHMLADDEGVHLKHWRDSWFVWRDGRTGGRYQPLEGADNKYAVPDMVRAVLKDAKYTVELKGDNGGSKLANWDPTTRSVREVTDAIAASARPDETMSSGSWIGADAQAREEAMPGPEITCVANGLLWCPTSGGATARQLMPHTPTFFTTSSVAVGYDPEAMCPRWTRFLEELWPGDEHSKMLLQEWFGYVLTRSTSLHKILALIGTRRCGKSTASWVLEQLLGGISQVDHPTMARLAETFGLAPMLGKRLAIVGDARLGKTDNAIVEKLLMISGEDPVTVNRKGLAEINVKLDTRIMIVSNSMPDLKDTTGALASRFLPLRIRIEGFYGKEDRNLKGVLGRELPGILRWALEGADRLWANGGKFTLGANTLEDMEEVEREGSKVKAFAMDRLEFGEDEMSVKDDVYRAWEVWCEENGYMATGKSVFVRDLRDAYPSSIQITKTTPATGRKPALRGVRLLPKFDY